MFRPWTARSTFQWKLGHYYDPSTGTKTLDHINLTSSVSPRSIHYYALSRPGTAPPDVTARMRDMQIQVCYLGLELAPATQHIGGPTPGFGCCYAPYNTIPEGF